MEKSQERRKNISTDGLLSCQLTSAGRAAVVGRLAGIGQLGTQKATGGSQFFIVYEPQPHLDGVHTVFGKTEDMDVVLKLTNGSRILKATLKQKSYFPKTTLNVSLSKLNLLVEEYKISLFIVNFVLISLILFLGCNACSIFLDTIIPILELFSYLE